MKTNDCKQQEVFCPDKLLERTVNVAGGNMMDEQKARKIPFFFQRF